MTLAEAISSADSLRPNTYPAKEKIKWLSRLDASVKAEVTDLYENAPSFEAYDENTDGDTVLLVPFPYDEIYISYLIACIHLADGEMTRYNNALVRFNDVFESFKLWYNRTHNHVREEYHLK